MTFKESEKAFLRGLVSRMMEECGIFRGAYDAQNGGESFMYGVGAVMAYLGDCVSSEYGDEVEKIFFENVAKSIDKAGQM